MTDNRFPEGFLWGTATAAYQIEGAAFQDGRGPSIWDTFSHTPGKTLNGETGDISCDHYNRWREDVKLIQELGLTAYRFSISWPRVLPQGAGQPNERGLDFYDRLVDELQAANITPFVTLYHWDLPQALQDRGGWANRDTVNAFASYADLVARRLGDRVGHWITHNEPWVAAFAGHYHGRHAPGIQDLRTALQVSHHLLLSHGRAVPALRDRRPDTRVGITLNLAPARPASPTLADRAAARLHDGYLNRWFLDPLFGRGYPADMLTFYGDEAPRATAEDLKAIAAPIDFLGVNYYSPGIVRAVSSEVEPLGFSVLSGADLAARGHEVTEMGWSVVPDGLAELLERVHRDYSPGAIYITENGAAFNDQVMNGVVNDWQRIAYLRRHLLAAHKAIASGVPLRGYFVWSLVDNFEWALGYGKRFGLIYVDYPTQARVPKASATWYRSVIAANAIADTAEGSVERTAKSSPAGQTIS
jgi:beta-glucosidase